MSPLYISEPVQFFLTMIGVLVFAIHRAMKEDRNG
jgi:hypothetical protein